ncbi:MAG TPA: nucleotide sugar dehydrogenase [Gemmataceae bacterium]
MADPSFALRAALREREACIGIVGLGYVGLPLAHAFSSAGFRVLGFDVDRDKVAKLNRGESYLNHIPSTWVQDMRAGRRFEATADFQRLAEVDTISITVPTPLNETRTPDIHYLEDAALTLATFLRPGQLVIVESTTCPGTTRQVVLPLLKKSGLRVGEDFFLAFSPEREDPGNRDFTIRTIPKVVGGIDPRSLELAAALYGEAGLRVVKVSTPEVAEACKILENTYRAVNISLVNELKVLYDRMGIDIWEVIEAAKTKPFGFQAFAPGPGLGGPCIPKDSLYLAWIANKYDTPTRLIDAATDTNLLVRDFVLTKTIDALNEHGKAVKGAKIAVLGVSYKKDVGDLRDSPALPIMDMLAARGARLSYNDPHIPDLAAPRRFSHVPSLTSQPLSREFLRDQDAVLIVADHSSYDWPWIVEHSSLVVDTRNATRDLTRNRERLIRA